MGPTKPLKNGQGLVPVLFPALSQGLKQNLAQSRHFLRYEDSAGACCQPLPQTAHSWVPSKLQSLLSDRSRVVWHSRRQCTQWKQGEVLPPALLGVCLVNQADALLCLGALMTCFTLRGRAHDNRYQLHRDSTACIPCDW